MVRDFAAFPPPLPRDDDREPRREVGRRQGGAQVAAISPGRSRARDCIAVIAIAHLAMGCTPEPESKVTRWASELPAAQPQGVRLPGPLDEPIPDPVDVAPPPPPTSVRPTRQPQAACERVIERACATLGVHSDECREVQDLVPSSAPPAIRAACALVVEEKGELLRPGRLGDGTSPCLLLVRTTCQRHGYKSGPCEEAKKASQMLTNARRTQACIGELLLLELKGALSPLGSE